MQVPRSQVGLLGAGLVTVSPLPATPPSGLVGRVLWRRTVFSSPVCVCSTASGSCWPRPPEQRHRHSLFLTAFPAHLHLRQFPGQVASPSPREQHLCSRVSAGGSLAWPETFLPSSGLSQQCLIPSLREANAFHVCSFLEYPRSALIPVRVLFFPP